MPKKIIISLTKDEAFVLFEFLARFNKIEHKKVVEDRSGEKM